MTTKSNWATRTKDALAKTPPAVPAGMKVVAGLSKEPISVFYRFTEPKKPNEKSRVLASGDTFEGTYEGSFESTVYEGQVTHKVRVNEGLIGLPGCGQLNAGLSQVPKGATVFISYNGKTQMGKGKFAGKEAHSFLVATDKTTAAAE